MLAVIMTAVLGVVAIGAVLFFFVLRGEDDPKPAANNTPTVQSTPTPEPDATEAPAKQAPAPTKETALIAVYNGTGAEGLAKQQTTLLEQDGYPKDNLATDNTPPDQQRQASVVMYRRGSKAVATQVGESLGITTVQQLDDATQQLIVNDPKKWNVVVIVGQDKTN
jgi:hypothetical protein